MREIFRWILRVFYSDLMKVIKHVILPIIIQMGIPFFDSQFDWEAPFGDKV